MCGCEVDGGAVVRLALTSRNRHRPGLGEVECRMCIECQTGNKRFAEFYTMLVGKLRLPQQIRFCGWHQLAPLAAQSVTRSGCDGLR